MQLYTFFIAFIIIFLAELGDKTQLLVLSFTSKSKIYNILIGIALGSLLSHGVAITFSSNLGILNNEWILHTLRFLTYITFLVLGIIGFISKKKKTTDKGNKFLKRLSNTSLNYVFIIALSVMVGELGDKTFFAALGLGVEYPYYKISLIAGCIFGMVMSNSVAIMFGKLLEKHTSEGFIDFLSNIIFILFGLIGIIMKF